MLIQRTNHNLTMSDHNEIRENTMFGSNKQKSPYIPLWKRGTKGDLFQAAAVTLVAVLFAPQAALADNECGVQVGTTPVDCDQTSYEDGVTYNAIGDLFIDFTASPTTEIESGGIDLSATGGDSITFDSASTNTEIESRETVGALLSVTTVNGDIDISTEEMDADGQTPDAVTHGIFAESTGSGDIDISVTGTVDAEGNSNSADSIGIEATTGSGDLTITSDSAGISGNAAGIKATTGTGLLTINAVGTEGGFTDQLGRSSDVGILANAGGDMEINIGSERTVERMDLTAAGEMVVNNSGRIIGSSSVAAIQAGGNTLTLNNDGVIGTVSNAIGNPPVGSGVLDFTSLAGGYTFNNNAGAAWNVGSTDGGQGADLGAGNLNNAGTIRFARGSYASAAGTSFTGTGDSLIEISNAVLDGAGQPNCTSPTLAACLDLSGGSTAGQTSIRFLTVENPDPLDVPLAPPVNPGIVVVDVGGGTSSADHFVLDPGSTGYATDSKYGSVLATGDLFDYTLLYNPGNQQHVLTSVPRREGMEYVSFIRQTLSIWHTTTDAVVGRQADLREGGARGGWARIVSENTERDAEPTLVTHGNTIVYDNGYSLDTKAFLAGYDMTYADNYVIGLHGGLMSADLKYDNSSSGQETKGAIAGLYAGWWNEAGLTLDGAVNVNFASIERSMRDFENSETNAMSYGARAEAGWRFSMSENFYVQPLATAAYVVGNIEAQDLRFYDATFENDESARAALGVRLGGDIGLTNDNFNRLKYWLTARAWEEFAGDDAQVHFKTEADPLVIEDDLSGSFEELGMGVSLTSPSEAFSLFLSGNAKLGDDADSYNLTIGTRLYW